VDSPLNVWVRRIGVPLLGTVILVLVFPGSARFIGPAFGVVTWTGAALGYIFIFAGIPFLLTVVGKAGYKAIIKPYVRARRIRFLRHRRLLREAAVRDEAAQQ
jgi:hypothetical protein